MLSKTELRKLIRAHNVVSKITIPRGATAEDMVKLLEEKNYEVDHENKVIKRKVSRGKQIKLKDTDKILTPKQKTALQKQKASEKKAEKEMEKKKKEREIKKKALADEKGRQKKRVREKLKKEPGTDKESQKKSIRDKLKKEPGRPVVNPKDIKVLGVKGKIGKKEDEVRPAESSRVRPTKKKVMKKKEEPNKGDDKTLDFIDKLNAEKKVEKKEEPKKKEKKEKVEKEPKRINKELEITLNNALIGIQSSVEELQASQLEDMDKDERKRSKAQLRILTRLIDTRKTKGFSKAEKNEIKNALISYLAIDDLSSENEKKAKQLQKIIFGTV